MPIYGELTSQHGLAGREDWEEKTDQRLQSFLVNLYLLQYQLMQAWPKGDITNGYIVNSRTKSQYHVRPWDDEAAKNLRLHHKELEPR